MSLLSSLAPLTGLHFGMAACGVLLTAGPAAAQLTGLPVLQSPFPAPRIAAAINGARSDGLSSTALAASWTPATARFQVSGGVARVAREGDKSGVGGGARVYLPLKYFATQSVAVGVFTGVGGDRSGGITTVTATPIGASVGYRRAIGATRALSLYAVPFYSYTRAKAADASSSVLRYAVGADAVVVPRVGLSVGFEGGAHSAREARGVRSAVTGLGVSYAF